MFSPDIVVDYRSLQKISGTAKNLRQYLSLHQTTTPTASPTELPSLQPLDFSMTDDVLHKLHFPDIPDDIVHECKRKTVDAITQLQNVCSKTYEQACHRILTTPRPCTKALDTQYLGELRKIYQTLYVKRYLPWLETRIQAIVSSYTVDRHPVSAKKRRAFNNEYTPLLEKYFEYNCYPSAPDRLVLARKSMMTPRQIEVWFQNHRNRARKEGRPLRKLASAPIPVDLCFESLKDEMPFFTIPVEERVPPPRQDVLSDGQPKYELTNLPPSTHVFTSTTPPHAFPATFPPRCSYDPFPNKGGVYTFPPPTWPRKAAVITPPKLAINFDDFIDTFASKFHLRESSKNDSRHDHVAHKPWFSSRVTIPSPAPHPSLIRSRGSSANQLPSLPSYGPSQDIQPTYSALNLHPSLFDKIRDQDIVERGEPVYSPRAGAKVPSLGRWPSNSPHQDGGCSRSPSSCSTDSSSSSGCLTTPPSTPTLSQSFDFFAEPCTPYTDLQSLDPLHSKFMDPSIQVESWLSDQDIIGL